MITAILSILVDTVLSTPISDTEFGKQHSHCVDGRRYFMLIFEENQFLKLSFRYFVTDSNEIDLNRPLNECCEGYTWKDANCYSKNRLN